MIQKTRLMLMFENPERFQQYYKSEQGNWYILQDGYWYPVNVFDGKPDSPAPEAVAATFEIVEKFTQGTTTGRISHASENPGAHPRTREEGRYE